MSSVVRDPVSQGCHVDDHGGAGGKDSRSNDRPSHFDDQRTPPAPLATQRINVRLDARPAELEKGRSKEGDAVMPDCDGRGRLEQGHQDRRSEIASRV